MAKITEIRCIRSRRPGTWVFVKVYTDQPGLYGIGSASDHYHAATVITAIETIAPKLIGREASHIEDNWQTVFTSAYWRNGSILNTALAGIDMALWDIKGKEAGMPVYQLLGGPVRAAVPAYAHAQGETLEELEEDVRRYVDEGYPVIRCQLGRYGGGGFLPPEATSRPKNAWGNSQSFDDEAYLENVPRMFEYLRDKLGFGPKFTHDVHEHLKPHNAVQLAKLLEPYRLFFLEDLLSPEQVEWYRLVRQQCTTPCRKIAALCEWFGVQTAWQEGGDNDPVNQMAAVHLDMTSTSFGIQEENHFRPEEYEAFPGHAVLEGGYLYPNDQPGLGIDVDEEKAARLLDPDSAPRIFHMAEDRRADGSIVRP